MIDDCACSLHAYNDDGKPVDAEDKEGCVAKFETALGGEVEPISNITEHIIDNEIPDDLTIDSNAQAAIARVWNTEQALVNRGQLESSTRSRNDANKDGAPGLIG
jgi:hypothetical protein